MSNFYSKAFLFSALGTAALLQQQPAAAQGMIHPGSPFGLVSPMNSIFYGNHSTPYHSSDNDDEEQQRRQRREAEEERAYHNSPEYKRILKEQEAAEQEALRASQRLESRLLHALASPSATAQDIAGILQDNTLPDHPDFVPDDAEYLPQARAGILGTFNATATAAQAGAIIDRMHDLHVAETNRRTAAILEEWKVHNISTTLNDPHFTMAKLRETLLTLNVLYQNDAPDPVVRDVVRDFLKNVQDPGQKAAAEAAGKKLDFVEAGTRMHARQVNEIEWGGGGTLALGVLAGIAALRRRRSEIQPG